MQNCFLLWPNYGILFVTEFQSTFYFDIPGQEECAKSRLSWAKWLRTVVPKAWIYLDFGHAIFISVLLIVVLVACFWFFKRFAFSWLYYIWFSEDSVITHNAIWNFSLSVKTQQLLKYQATWSPRRKGNIYCI